MLEGLAPDGFQGMGHIGGKSLIVATKGIWVLVRVVVSTDWVVLRAGVVDWCFW